MPEPVVLWWARRQWSKDAEVPYPIGRFRSDWERYPVLVRQYHPDLNAGVTLTQIPPAAEVWLLWECDAGHRFVATPAEQRGRPGRERRRSSWCPECFAAATGRSPARAAPLGPAAPIPAPIPIPTPIPIPIPTPTATPERHPPAEAPRRILPCGHPPSSPSSGRRRTTGDGGCRVCRNARAGADRVAVGDAFWSPWAPRPASAAEADLRQRLDARLSIDPTMNAVRVRTPFFDHLEVWPDILLPELRVAIEYDTVGRHGLEHVGLREAIDRRKDRLLRQSGWEVVRVRCGKLAALGPFDVLASGVTDAAVGLILDALREIRGEILVDAWLR